MKLIVDIPDEIYKQFMEDRIKTIDVLHAVRHGTPLPEHHGRLISEEDMLSMIIFSKLFDDAKVGEVKEAIDIFLKNLDYKESEDK